MDIQKTINMNIKELRKKHGLTQEKFAEKVGLTPQGVSNIERNKYLPSAESINKICEEFDITPDVLCRIEIKNASKTDVIRQINSKLNRLSLQELKQVLKITDTFTK